jgi:hypothetical protein
VEFTDNEAVGERRGKRGHRSSVGAIKAASFLIFFFRVFEIKMFSKLKNIFFWRNKCSNLSFFYTSISPRNFNLR